MNISRRKFYEKIGVSRGTLESNTGITEEIMTKFITTFPEISIEWLFFGNGKMLRENTNQTVQDSTDTQENIQPQITQNQHKDTKNKANVAILTKENKGIPLIPASAFAGGFTGNIQILEYECERYVIPMFKDADFLIPVKGSSMYPKYSSGDVVACKKLPSWNFFQWGKVYVLYTDQGPIIKRVCEGKDEDHVLIVSDNAERYKAFQLLKSEIIDVAIVLGVIRME